MILDLFRTGQNTLKQKAKEEEATKKGILRGGNSGLLFEDGNHTGYCMSQTWLRLNGGDTKILESSSPNGGRELMFEAGRVNEDAWHNTLIHSGWNGTILREEQIPVKWSTKNGTLVTGRPDMVLLDEQGTPKVGIELKLVSSIWTARTVLITRTPKLAHLIQAAHYSWQLGVPFELWYTNRTDFEASSDFSTKAYPAYGEPGSELFTYRFYKIIADPSTGEFKKSVINEAKYNLLRSNNEEVEAKVGKYLPFVQGFKLSFDTKGRLWYVDACNPDAEAQLTVVTKERIQGYYEKLSTLDKVPKEPLTIKPNGKPENYKLSSYCSLGDDCCRLCEGDALTSWGPRVLARLGNIRDGGPVAGRSGEEKKESKETAVQVSKKVSSKSKSKAK